MKIIQTFWTKPYFDNSNTKSHNRFSGGWPDRTYNYMSWALSCLQFRKYYDNVELITDQLGKRLLIDNLKLPYTHVEQSLDCLNNYPTELWAISKIYSYQIQNEPFIHADGDVFIWKEFDNRIIKSELCAQQLITDHRPQIELINTVIKSFSNIPNCIVSENSRGNTLCGSNAGIYGGYNIDFFKEFAKLAFDFVDSNGNGIKTLNTSLLGLVYEEFLFFCLAKQKKIDVEYLLPSIENEFAGNKLVNFEGIFDNTEFIHPLGTFKTYPVVYKNLAETLRLIYPDYYYRIQWLVKKGYI